MTRVLVIDDEPAICRSFEALLKSQGCAVTVAASAEEGLKIAEQEIPDAVVLDVRLPGMDGLTAISRFREITDAPIVVMTAHGDLSTAVSAVEKGAFDYVPKPFDLDNLTAVLRRAIRQSELQKEVATSGSEGVAESAPTELVGSSAAMQSVFRQIALAAQHDAPVLITGESGTGKELVAQAIHSHSRRRRAEIVAVHLASLNESLLERELFGHRAGAFTGADRTQHGLLHRANAGTLFLDEIGEAPKEIQVKLLRILETGEYYPVGESRPSVTDFRLICATNRTIDFLRDELQFRSDLFYRIAAIHLHLPPLRERREDIALLAQHFLKQVAGDEPRQFSTDALEALRLRDFPGNVRELRNTVVRAATQTRHAEIAAEDLPKAERGPEPAERPGDANALLGAAIDMWAHQRIGSGSPGVLADAIRILEARLIPRAIDACQGNRSAAAELLGIHRETLREKLRKS
ncbi:MAG: sigma-54-dependent Fis family transcriptional regulator [Planctomycetaceae bacterium]|nr:sigma-54-dependent Fis family transcriptional regulator [Planctomycetaceae bacterium]